MAKVKIEEVVYHLSTEFQRALTETVKKHFPGLDFDEHEMFRDFQQEVYSACSIWEYVPDHYIEHG